MNRENDKIAYDMLLKCELLECEKRDGRKYDIDKDGVQVKLFESADNKDLLVVAFEGTCELKDWVKNLVALRKGNVENNDGSEKKGHGFHFGFWVGWLTAEKEGLEGMIMKSNRSEIIFTGHSQGGAFALIAASMLCDKITIKAVYTFGCPRIGDKDAMTNLNSEKGGIPVYQYINGLDRVPNLPPWFSHPVLPHYITRKGISMKRPFGRYLPLFSIKDHEVINYVKAMERALSIK